MSISKEQWTKIVSIVLSAALAVFAVLGWVFNPSVPVPASSAPVEQGAGIGTTQFTSPVLFRENITAARDASIVGNLTVTGSATLGAVAPSSLAATGALSAGTFLIDAKAASVTVTNTTFVPLGTFQPITATTGVTPTIGLTSTATAGTVLILENISSQTITFADTGTQVLGGTRALGQYDILGLIFDGTNWVELYLGNN